MPTGVALRDAREQLFAAARRLLLQSGPAALTSRTVTAEAGVAKGVIHRHFPDFDAFLAEFVLDRIAGIDHQAAELRAAAGSGTVTGNLTSALTDLFDPVTVATVGLVISRDGVRERLRQAGTARVPLLGEGTAMVADYLTAEHDLGRIAAHADIRALAPTLVGAAHLLFTDREARPTEAAVAKSVAAAVAGVLQQPQA